MFSTSAVVAHGAVLLKQANNSPSICRPREQHKATQVWGGDCHAAGHGFQPPDWYVPGERGLLEAEGPTLEFFPGPRLEARPNPDLPQSMRQAASLISEAASGLVQCHRAAPSLDSLMSQSLSTAQCPFIYFGAGGTPMPLRHMVGLLAMGSTGRRAGTDSSCSQHVTGVLGWRGS